MSVHDMPADELGLLAGVIANVPVGVLAAEPDLCCAYANERLARIAGRRPAQLHGDGFAGAVAPRDRDRLRRTCEAVVADHRELVEEVVLCTPDALERRVEVRLGPLTAADGVARGVVGIVQERGAPAEARTTLAPTIGYVAQLD